MLSMAGSILDYSPDVPTYRAELRRFINQAYRELFSNDVWLFAQREEHIEIQPDVSITGLSLLIGPDGNVQLQDPAPGSRSLFRSWMATAIVEITEATGGASFPALPIELQARIFVDANNLILEDKDGRSLVGAVFAATGVSVTIKQRFIDMPLDCVDVMSVALRFPSQERQPFYNLTRWEDENLLLNMDLVGRPTNFILAEDVVIEAPVFQPNCVNLGAVANTVPVAGDYDVVYVHQKGSRLSAPSPNSTLTNFAATHGLSVTGMQNNGADNSTGLRKKVYVRTPQSECFYEISDASAAESVTAAGAVNGVGIPASYQLTKNRLSDHDGIYRRVRMYPRQDEQLTITVRYLSRPPRLLDDSDVPGFPPEYHQLLVFRCCEQLFVKHGNAPLSQLYRQRAENVLTKMQKRYKTTRSQMLVKGDFRQSSTRTRPFRTLRHIT
jgi:hypothetical protein